MKGLPKSAEEVWPGVWLVGDTTGELWYMVLAGDTWQGKLVAVEKREVASPTGSAWPCAPSHQEPHPTGVTSLPGSLGLFLPTAGTRTRQRRSSCLSRRGVALHPISPSSRAGLGSFATRPSDRRCLTRLVLPQTLTGSRAPLVSGKPPRSLAAASGSAVASVRHAGQDGAGRLGEQLGDA